MDYVTLNNGVKCRNLAMEFIRLRRKKQSAAYLLQLKTDTAALTLLGIW